MLFRSEGSQFSSSSTERGHSLIQKTPVTFDRSSIAAEQSRSHEVMNHGCRGRRDIIGLTVPDDGYSIHRSRIGLNPQRHQAGHDVVRDSGFERDNARPTLVRMFLRRAGGSLNHSRLWIMHG